MGRHVNKN